MILSDKHERYEVTYQGFLFTHKKIYWGLSQFHVKLMCEAEFPAAKIISVELSPVVSSPTYA